MPDNFKPIKMQWEGDVFKPLGGYWTDLANEELVVGKIYTVTDKIERSGQSHGHYFGCIREAWNQLPEHIVSELPTPEHLRKYALIHTGYFNERQFVASNPRQAERLASFMNGREEFAVLSINDCVVIERTAKSQSLKAMDTKAEFEQSKEDVLGFCSELIGVALQDLKQNLGKAA